MNLRPPCSTLFPYTTLFRSSTVILSRKVGGSFRLERWTTPNGGASWRRATIVSTPGSDDVRPVVPRGADPSSPRSEEHTSELQSRQYLVCRLLLEKKKKTKK